jgi:hypothetical protein
MLLFLPIGLASLRVWRTLAMVTTEERITAENDVLSVYPVFVGTSAVLVDKSVFHIDVAAPLAQGVGRYSGIVCKEIVTPFCA